MISSNETSTFDSLSWSICTFTALSFRFSFILHCITFVAAQKDPSCAQSEQLGADEKIFSQLLNGKGEYTLVYEDNEGNRMLVGDVPWK